MSIQNSIQCGSRRTRFAVATAAVIAWAALSPMAAHAQTLERVAQSGHIRFGYLTDARPFSSRTESGSAEGYSIQLCEQIAAQVKVQLKLQELTVDWVPVPTNNRLEEVQQGRVDLLCAPTSVTADRRAEASFSIPIFAAGNRSILRADAPVALREALAANPAQHPVWRGSPATKVLTGTTFVAVSGTTTEKWLATRKKDLQVDARIVTVPDLRTGLQQLLDRKADVLVADRTGVLSILDASNRDKVIILDRMLTHEPVSLAMARGDEDFRLLVDRSLSELYASDRFAQIYEKWIGPLEPDAHSFFVWNTLAQ
ncbi:MAG: amino acid ABC transporter substrate-binding protein [Povalibacter sp.]